MANNKAPIDLVSPKDNDKKSDESEGKAKEQSYGPTRGLPTSWIDIKKPKMFNYYDKGSDSAPLKIASVMKLEQLHPDQPVLAVENQTLIIKKAQECELQSIAAVLFKDSKIIKAQNGNINNIFQAINSIPFGAVDQYSITMGTATIPVMTIILSQGLIDISSFNSFNTILSQTPLLRISPQQSSKGQWVNINNTKDLKAVYATQHGIPSIVCYLYFNYNIYIFRGIVYY